MRALLINRRSCVPLRPHHPSLALFSVVLGAVSRPSAITHSGSDESHGLCALSCFRFLSVSRLATNGGNNFIQYFSSFSAVSPRFAPSQVRHDSVIIAMESVPVVPRSALPPTAAATNAAGQTAMLERMLGVLMGKNGEVPDPIQLEVEVCGQTAVEQLQSAALSDLSDIFCCSATPTGRGVPQGG